MSSQNSNAANPNPGPKDNVDAARDDLASAAEHTKRAAEEAGAQAKHAAEHIAEDAKDAAMDEAREAKSAGANSASRVAEELDRAASNCREDDVWAQKLLAEGASSLRTASHYLSGNRVEDLLRDGESFARKNPAAYLGASVAAGFLLARLGKTATARAVGDTPTQNTTHPAS